MDLWPKILLTALVLVPIGINAHLAVARKDSSYWLISALLVANILAIWVAL